MRQSGLAIEIGHEAFEFADMHSLTLLGKHAIALALTLVGAYATANCGQIAAVVDDTHGITEVAFGHLSDPVGNIIADRASLLASGHLAVETSLSLLDSLGQRIAVRHLFEIIYHGLLSRINCFYRQSYKNFLIQASYQFDTVSRAFRDLLFGPDACLHFTDMGLLQQIHAQSALSYPATDGIREISGK